MGLIIALIVGSVAGWIAGLARRSHPDRGRSSSILVGILGALLGGFVLGPRLGGGNLLENAIDPMTPVVTLTGAVILLALVHLLRRGRWKLP